MKNRKKNRFNTPFSSRDIRFPSKQGSIIKRIKKSLFDFYPFSLGNTYQQTQNITDVNISLDQYSEPLFPGSRVEVHFWKDESVNADEETVGGIFVTFIKTNEEEISGIIQDETILHRMEISHRQLLALSDFFLQMYVKYQELNPSLDQEPEP